MQLAGPFTGCVAVIASWLIAVPKFRALAKEIGVELPTLVRVPPGGPLRTDR